MSSRVPTQTEEYVPIEYLSFSSFLDFFGITEEEQETLPRERLVKFKQFVNDGNRKVEATLYPYVDALPLDKLTEEVAYAKSLAFNYSLWKKLITEGSDNAAQQKTAWESDRTDLIRVMQAIPRAATIRTVVGNDYKETFIPFSQSYGLSDFL